MKTYTNEVDVPVQVTNKELVTKKPTKPITINGKKIDVKIKTNN